MAKAKKKHLGFKECLNSYLLSSKLVITEAFNHHPTQKTMIGINIFLTGDIAHIPSLKNQKIQGTNILRPAPRAKLVAMTKLYEVKSPKICFDEPIHVFISCAYRPNRFDTDNVLTTVKDWLEPRFIRQKDRGWGVGIVPNDYHVNGYAKRKIKGEFNSDCTEIIIRKDSYIKQYLDIFLKGFGDER